MKIVNKGFNKNEQDSGDDPLNALLAEAEDPLENLVEGIFIFASGSQFKLPVDE